MTDLSLTPTSPRVERARHLLDRAIFALLLALTMLAAVPFGSVDPWWEGVFEGCAFALGALWMMEGMLAGRWLVREHRLLVPLVVLLAYAFAQTLPYSNAATVAGVEVRRSLSADPFETWRFVVKLASLVLCAALWLRYLSSARRLRALVYVVALVGLSSALFGVVRRTMGSATLEQLSPRLAANLDGFAQFINRNHFAFLAEMTLGLALGLLVGEWRRRERVPVYAAAALVLWGALVMSNSRGGLLGMFVELALVALLSLSSGRRRRRASQEATRDADARHSVDARVRPSAGRLKVWLVRLALVGCLLAAALVGVVWVGGERLGARLESVPVEVSGTSKVRWGDRRVEIWPATWRMIAAHPLTGTGFGAYRAGITEYHDASGEMSLEQAHNDFLELPASGGIIGIALAVWFAISFAARARDALRSHDSFRRAACVGALGGLSAVLVHSLFDFGLHVTINALVCAALVVIATSDNRVQQRIPTDKIRAHRSLEVA
ncbi:MAG: O-antigen ligase family protein [Acidobacteria bacterium]|nr:O-antigen ligase family protein [Acidobacteriota bacterium]